MKKIVNILILMVICLLPTVVDAKLSYEFDWDLYNAVYLNKENNKYNFLEYYYSIYTDSIFTFDENGQYLSEKTFISEDLDVAEFTKTKEFEAYKNLYIEYYNYVYNEDNMTFYRVRYYNETFRYYDSEQDKNVTIDFEEDLNFTKKLLGTKYDIFLKLKNDSYNVERIDEFDDYYVVNYYYNDNVNYTTTYYTSVFDKDLNSIINFDSEEYDDYYKIYVHDGLIYVAVDNLNIDIYKLDGTKYDTMKLEHNIISAIDDSCSGFYLSRILIEGNEMFLHYEENQCETRIVMNDASDVQNVVGSEAYLGFIVLKYTLDFDVDTVESSSGEFTYETKVDEDGRSYVELKVTPKDGYSVEEIIVTDINGERIEVTNNKFYKPANDVKIEVKYVLGEYLPIPDTFLGKSFTVIIIGLILVGLGFYTINYVKGESKLDI